LDQAIEDFWEALRKNREEISAKIGLGWSRFYYSQTYPACTPGEGDPEGAREYRRHLELARSAYSSAINQEKAAIHYRVRAQLEYLLRFCDGLSRGKQYELSRADYDQAIALREERAVTSDDLSAVWYNRRGNLSYALANFIYTDTRKIEEARRLALEDYRRATEVEPQTDEWWNDWVDVASEWGDHEQEISGYRELILHGPADRGAEAYWRLGWLVYLYEEDYEQSLQYSARALELNRDLAPVHWNEGLVYVVQGKVEAAVQSYLNGIEAADRTGQERQRRYQNAIFDLSGNLKDDPQGVAASFSVLLEAARTKEACMVAADAAPALLFAVRPDPFAPTGPPAARLWPSDEFLPAARAPDGDWLYGVIKGQEIFGWLDASPGVLSCSYDISVLPVVDPALLRAP
jgi:tetratricopeptide (TPR) repeat protein